MALETAETGVTCNAICPGWVKTPLVVKQIEDRAKQNVRSLSIHVIEPGSSKYKSTLEHLNQS